MTTYSKRRGRRSLAAILAAMLIASVLAVVAGSPAQAANTAGEALVDSNGDGVDDAREFGGTTRYDTSIRLAQNFVDYRGGAGSTPNLFVASGESLVDAVAVSGLAGEKEAPVLLTPPDDLYDGVADFIEDNKVENVYVLGGVAAVSNYVMTQIKELQNKPTVTRIGGVDRYATAAALAGMQTGTSQWCSSDEASAVLVNGGDVSLAEAMLIAPIANRLRLPVLLTPADELSESAAEYIRTKDIEHVQIVGGADTVSDAVKKAVTALGVTTVARTGGSSAAATSVEVAKLLGNKDCKDALAPPSTDFVALAHERALPDGVSAASVLANSYDNGNLVPLLVVNDSLPAAVSDWLAATPKVVDGKKSHLSILAIGGPAAVSTGVMDAAVKAAAAGDALTVSITADGKNPLRVNGKTIVLTFSDVLEDGVDAAAKAAAAKAIAASVLIDGRPVVLDTDTANVPTFKVLPGVAADDDCSRKAVELTLKDGLKSGQKVTVPGGAMPGIGSDKRKVLSASVTVATGSAPKADVVVFTGLADEDAWVSVSDADGDGPAISTLAAANVKVKLGSAAARVLENAELSDGVITLAGDVTSFKAGDYVEIVKGAFTDTAGNKSITRRIPARSASKAPRVQSVLLSSETNTMGTALIGSNLQTETDGTAAHIAVTAKADAAAGGVHAEGWRLVFTALSNRKPANKANIDVQVDKDGKTVYATIRDGAPTWGNLKSALEDDKDFASLFTVALKPAGSATDCAAAATTPLAPADDHDQQIVPLTGGQTKVNVQVRFSGHVRANTDWTALRDDVLAMAKGDARGLVDAQIADDVTSTTMPVREVLFTITVANGTDDDDELHLPRAGDKVTVGADVALDFSTSEGVANTATSATSPLTITRSGSVKAP